jgi:hypothetical protein
MTLTATHALPVVLAAPAKGPTAKFHVAAPVGGTAVLTLCGTRMSDPRTYPDWNAARAASVTDEGPFGTCTRCFPFLDLLTAPR